MGREKDVQTGPGKRVLTVFPDLSREPVGALVKQGCDIVVQRVHVLHQPLVGLVVHLTEQGQRRQRRQRRVRLGLTSSQGPERGRRLVSAVGTALLRRPLCLPALSACALGPRLSSRGPVAPP